MLTVLVPTTGASGDLPVLRASLAAYAPDVPVIVHAGEPSFGAACRALLRRAPEDADPLFFLNDDTVVTPETCAWLREDWASLQETTGALVGVLGCRTNTGPWTPQNIRWISRHMRPKLEAGQWDHERRVMQVPLVFGAAFCVSRAALAAVPDDWTALHWFSDNLLCYDLAQRGYKHFVSRAYVHHLGSRSTGGVESWPDLEQGGKAWLRAHRPDFLEAMGWA